MSESFKTVTGKLDFTQANGAMLSVTLPVGARCPEKVEEVAKYVGERVAEALSGVGNSEALKLKDENDKLKRKIDELIAEKKDATTSHAKRL